MPITAQSADGVQHQFPDGTDPSVIDKVMKAYAQQAAPAASVPTAPQGESFDPRSDIRPPWERMIGAPRRTDPTFAESVSAAPSWPQIQQQVGQRQEQSFQQKTGKTVEQDPVGFASFSLMDPEARHLGFATTPMFAPGEGLARTPIMRDLGMGAPITLPPGAKQRAETLRGEALRKASDVAKSEEAGAAAEASRAQALKQAQKVQPKVAEQRRVRQEMEARKQGQFGSIADAQQAALAKLRDRVNDLRQSYIESGMNVGAANRQVALAQRQLQEAEAGVAALHQELLARPSMTEEEFGSRIRQLTRSLHDKYTEIRKVQSGFTQAVEGGGSTPIVNTAPTQALIDQHLKDVRNPTLQAVMTDIKDMLTTKTTGKSPTDATATVTTSTPRLSVKAADSLRGYLDSILRSKMAGDRKIDRETLFVVRQIKKALMEAATQASPAYRQALGKWSTLSRPLNIVENKGALRKVIDTDPVSSDYALTEAQVVGAAVRGARAGHPTLSRLVSENPEFKDAARLFFTQDLFSGETVRAPDAFRKWLLTNERPLRQTGLYDEFKDIRKAREAAQNAVDQAKGLQKESAAELKASEEAQKGAVDQLKRAESLRDKQLTQIAKRKALDKAGPDAKVISTTRIKEQLPLEQKAKQAQVRGEQRRAAADLYQRFQTKIKIARPDQVESVTSAFFERLQKDGHITTSQYDQLMQKVKAVEGARLTHEKRMARLGRLARYAAYLAYGYEGFRAARDILGY